MRLHGKVLCRLKVQGGLMEILFVSSEVVPFAKAGGLADVSHHLPKALAKLGHTVSVVTPKYSGSDDFKVVTDTGAKITVPMTWRNEEASIYASDISGLVTVYLIGKDAYYDRQGLYGNAYGDYEDNAERFIFFSRSILELCKRLEMKPDVIHCNDWQTGLVPAYLKTLYRDYDPLSSTATVFTIHNLGSQGIFWVYDLSLTGLGWEYFTPETLEFYGNLNLMKGGLVFADLISTVSPTYAEEILSPEYGFGLHGLLTKRKNDLRAILNGVDYDTWDPRNDTFIATQYDVEHLDRKLICKRDLQDKCNLDKNVDGPLVAIVSRLLDRKGLDLVSASFEQMLDLGSQFVIMGKGEDRYHSFFKEMASARPDRVWLSMVYDYPTAHRIESAADMILVPSRYEPCGLDQLYSLRYGTIPLVRATGGLEDTVVDYDPQANTGTGFKFYDYTPDSLMGTFKRAVEVYAKKAEWLGLMKRAMKCEFSWESAAIKYIDLYGQAIEKRRMFR